MEIAKEMATKKTGHNVKKGYKLWFLKEHLNWKKEHKHLIEEWNADEVDEKCSTDNTGEITVEAAKDKDANGERATSVHEESEID